MLPETHNNSNLGVYTERLAGFLSSVPKKRDSWLNMGQPTVSFRGFPVALLPPTSYITAKSGKCLEGEIGCVLATNLLSLVFLYVRITLRLRKFQLYFQNLLHTPSKPLSSSQLQELFDVSLYDTVIYNRK